MNESDLINSFGEIKQLIDQSRENALKSVNRELIMLYLNIGSIISQKMAKSQWGDKTIDGLAEYLRGFGPDYKGFNRRNLYRMMQFYRAYPKSEIVSALLTQLSWTNHLLILSKTKTEEERQLLQELRFFRQVVEGLTI